MPDPTPVPLDEIEAALDELGCCYEWWDTTCAKRGDPEPCHFCIVNERLAAVRELVDLGEKP